LIDRDVLTITRNAISAAGENVTPRGYFPAAGLAIIWRARICAPRMRQGLSTSMTRLRDLVRREPKRGMQIPRWLERLVSVGIVAEDPQLVRRQRCVNVAVLVVTANSLSHLVILSVYNLRGLMVIHAYNLIMTVTPLLIPRLHRFGENVGAVALILLVLVGNTFVVWAFGLTSDLQIYFTLAGAMLLFFGVQNWKLFLVYFSLYVIVLLLALNFAPENGFILPDDGKLRDLLSSHAMINTITSNAAMIFYALTALQRAELELQNQYERSEALIATVMPFSIAERLKSGHELRIADRIEMLSVMFADLVDFTGAAHDLPPDEVVAFLDGLVRNFDALCEQFGVEKIKTIGDSYMAAAGFDRPTDGATAIGHLALAMIDAVGRQPALGGRQLRLRIGIHSGPATAGVIGDTRFSYDVWGDAVNTASRLESHGEPGRIQVSEDFRELAAEAFILEERGFTDLKGIGAVRTFFLVGLRPKNN
jgi:adenylate cyclase